MNAYQSEKQKKSIDFSIKATWLAISKMYNVLGGDYDITHSTGFVLLNIDKEHGTPATKIAPMMGMEARSLTRMLKTMEEKGFIYREADEHDRRKVMIKLTEEGRRRREMSKQTVKVFQGRINDVVTDREMQNFFKVIDKIHGVINHQQSMLQEIQSNLALKGIKDEDLKKA
ncbi:MarR family winged helix-turn-helix transcriptional regulator [Sediminitomix flava]|uniref:DNA-binding MarR family transcriptional regulator n=1 Tax=Sediminitomix flava TaxID=379075 RepID=A0A315ZTW4_SEDFL|nr:MarR family transcriptional regulator [Sediminitomix flava]PWJ39119.1 DNA-binding MarR family transcriptional regulator [Sediminitomix flava]